MEISFFVKGLALGLSVAAPVGPISILCIRRTLSYGRLSGILSGLGDATVIALFGMIAAFGISIISDLMLSAVVPLRFVGGILLFYLGITAFRSKPPTVTDIKKSRLLNDYLSTFFLALSNPMTIISFTALFTALGLGGSRHSTLDGVYMVFGVFAGVCIWWCIFVFAVHAFRSKLTPHILRVVNRISGIIIILFAIYSWASLLG